MGEAEIDRDFSRLFFRQAIRIGPSQRLDQRAFAMVDVAGSGEDKVLLGHA